MRHAFLICGLIALVALPADAGEQLTIAVSPAHAFAPAFLKVRIRVERSVENRSLEVIADSGNFYRSSQIELDGHRAPLFVELQLRSVPEGDYRVVGILRDGQGHERSLVYQDVRVIGLEIGG